ncbi:MAG: OBAP family protein [Thermoproteota archaeon]|nr:OBAP family protein [Thermoproteota archaeon]
MSRNILYAVNAARLVTAILLLLIAGAGTNISITTIFAQTSNATNTTSPVDSFSNPAGYAIGKKHIYDAPLLDVHFYCSSESGGIMATCLIFDGNATDSSLIGIEYIISAEQYATLPEREKPNWSPISAEEESELRYPNLSPQQLQQVEEQFRDTYVKLILTWNPTDNLPQYPPQVVVESLIGGGGEEEEEHMETPSNQSSS